MKLTVVFKECRSAARALAMSCTLIAVVGLGGCEAINPLAAPQASATVDSGGAGHVPSNDPLRTGYQHFHDGEYGLAQSYFQDAVERSPRDVKAWLGLAASYDKLARFDLADKAYRSAVKLSGRTAQILNNEGYSHLLRGDVKQAGALFREALRASPDNRVVKDNLALLDAGARYLPTQAE